MYKAGDWKAICDQCGREAMASKMTKRWDGLMVHADMNEGCLETRHPQEFVRSVNESQPLPWTRPQAPDRFIGPTYPCSAYSERWYDSPIETGPTIGKGFTTGPAMVTSVVTVICSWDII